MNERISQQTNASHARGEKVRLKACFHPAGSKKFCFGRRGGPSKNEGGLVRNLEKELPPTSPDGSQGMEIDGRVCRGKKIPGGGDSLEGVFDAENAGTL